MMDDKDSRRGVVQLVLNIAYVLVGIVILVLGLVVWLSESRRAVLVPCVYGMAALMCALHMVDLIRNMPRGKKNWTGVLVTMAGIPLMMAMAVLTYISLR